MRMVYARRTAVSSGESTQSVPQARRASRSFPVIENWSPMCSVLCGVASVLVYLHWKKLGGDKDYKPIETQ